jgi:fluoroacetyl-CoA thioesterase
MELLHLSGLSHSAETTVVESITASAVGSGGVDVLSTPSLILLFEQAARDAVQHALPEGFTTVGIKVDIEHISATPLGEHVRAEATVIAVEGRRITFEVSAVDEHGTIGFGNHVRSVINLNRFMKKLSDRNK